MRLSNKILFCTLLLSYLTIASFTVFAQSKIKRTTKKPEHKTTTLGIQTGKDLYFNTSSALHNKQGKMHYGTNKALVLRKSLNTHFKAEAGFSYNTPLNQNGLNFFPAKVPAQNNVSVPVTIQYYFLPEKYKLHPYCGAGLQGNICCNNGTQPNYASGDVRPDCCNTPADTKYISILFTQGVTFEVNTRIQVSQSFHFIPGNTTRVIGLDLGIGYKFP